VTAANEGLFERSESERREAVSEAQPNGSAATEVFQEVSE
jgi:hypothetical protein